MNKYREKIGPNTFFVYSINPKYGERRLHDNVKGWGTVSKSGKTILWDNWRRPKVKRLTPKQALIATEKQRESFAKFIFPVIDSVIPDAPILKEIFATPLYRVDGIPNR